MYASMPQIRYLHHGLPYDQEEVVPAQGTLDLFIQSWFTRYTQQ